MVGLPNFLLVFLKSSCFYPPWSSKQSNSKDARISNNDHNVVIAISKQLILPMTMLLCFKC